MRSDPRDDVFEALLLAADAFVDADRAERVAAVERAAAPLAVARFVPLARVEVALVPDFFRAEDTGITPIYRST